MSWHTLLRETNNPCSSGDKRTDLRRSQHHCPICANHSAIAVETIGHRRRRKVDRQQCRRCHRTSPAQEEVVAISTAHRRSEARREGQHGENEDAFATVTGVELCMDEAAARSQ
nr:hypothetical protein Itr_chr14CG09730 [Ipomoea trifida]